MTSRLSIGSAAVLGLFVVAASSCGGTDGDGRATEQFEQATVLDRGSAEVACSVTDDYEFQMLADFELGAVTGGWYMNNDQCDKCMQAGDRIKVIDTALAATDPVDKYGCPVDPTVVAEAWAAEKAELTLAKEEGDPALGIPANCEAVCSASQSPNPFVKPIAASRIAFDTDSDGTLEDQPRCGSRYALHIQGNVPFTKWGGVLGAQFGSPGLDLDTSDEDGGVKYEGISFWARVAPNTRIPLRVEMSDEHTDDKQIVYEGELVSSLTSDEMTEWCKDPTYVCNPDALRDDTDGCDKFGANDTMSTNWQFFTFGFEFLRQSGWGQKAVDAEGRQVGLDINQVRSLSFVWSTGNLDVWIDDIAFYRRK